ncbi:MAG TPA: HU family DNA-binding protein [Ignavibacteria bacterium]|nr:HU family DNA-binding protein [Ignavibacteria bacterium]
MNKEQLISQMASSAKISKRQAKDALDSFVTSVKKSVKKGDRVSLVGFGTFSQGKRNARTGRNPRTGETINIAAKKTARFKAGSGFSSFVNGGK